MRIQLKRVRASINDWDGPHCNSFSHSFQLLPEVVRQPRFGLELDIRVARRLIRNWGLRGFILASRSFYVTQEVGKQIYAEWCAMEEQKPCPLEAGSRPTLKYFHEHGVVNTILTSRPREPFMSCYLPHKLQEYISLIVAAEDTKFHKPDPRSTDTTMEFLANLEEPIFEDECIFIGDTRSDYDAAIGRGITPFIVRTGPYGCLDIGDIDPICVVPTIGHVIPRLKRLGVTIG